jgi:superfamily II DNA or RNA helicase
MPTGTGKTIVFGSVIMKRGGRGLVLAHRDELIEQAADKIRLINPDADLGIVKAAKDDCDADIVVASVQTLSRSWRLSRLRPNFRTVVVDEAHHASADSYLRILEHVGSFSDDGPLTLGVTATPERADGTPLTDVWQEIVCDLRMLDMIEQGYLADLRAIQIHLKADFDDVHTRGGDLVVGELDEVLRAAAAPAHTVRAYQEYAGDRQTLVFTPTVALARETASAFSKSGIAAAVIDGAMPLETRRDVLARFRRREVRVIANCAVLTEGFDEPSIECVIIARPTKSRPLYVQMVGRGTRPWPGKADCLILDLVGSTTRHNLVTAASLFHLPSDALETGERTLREAVAAERAKQADTEARGRLIARTVDLFANRSMHWVISNATRYVLSLGDAGLLVLTTSDMQQWTAVHSDRRGGRRVVADRMDLGFAQGVAEDYARRLGSTVFTNRDAPWRRQPATATQLDALRRWRIAVRPDVTKGEASDLISARIARRLA